MADAAWSPDDSRFRSPWSDERSLAGQKASCPDMKGITRLTSGPFHRFRTQPSGFAD
jgi:hypothetical protein